MGVGLVARPPATKPAMQVTLVIHTHRHGTDVRVFSELVEPEREGPYDSETHPADAGELSALFGIDFEPDKNEFVDVIVADVESLKTRA